MAENVGKVDLPPDSYPFDVEFYHVETKEVLRSIHVAEPGVMRIPGYKELGVDKGSVGVRCIYANGETYDTEDDDDDEN